MAQTKILTIVQTIHVSHRETVERRWYDVVEKTIEREIDVDGAVVEESVVDETVVDEHVDLEEDVVDSEQDEEIVDEEFVETAEEDD